MPIPSIDDWLANQGGSAGASEQLGANALDTGAGKRPYMDIDSWLESQNKAPQISPETTAAVTKKPQGRPGLSEGEQAASYGTVLPQLTQSNMIAGKGVQGLEDQGIKLSPYMTGNYQPTQQRGEGELSPYVTGGDFATVPQVSQEAAASYQEWYREEGLPAAGVVLGTMAAPATGGTSFWAALGASAAGAGAGAFVGEAVEQTLKGEGVMQLAIGEEAPRNGWDILNRATVKAGQEAALDAIGGLFLRGITYSFGAMLRSTAKPRILADGTVVDQQKVDLVDTMRRHMEMNSIDESKAGEYYLASQAAEVAHYNFLEDVAKASYIGGKNIEATLAKQSDVIIGESKEMVGELTTEAKSLVAETDGFLGNYYKAAMDNTNDFVVAGLVRTTFESAQNQRKSVARGLYNTMDELANGTKIKQVVEEVPSGFFNPDGSPITVQKTVTREVTRFPVYTKEVSEWAADKLDDTLLKADPILGELMGLPKQANMKQVGEALSELKGRSRTLGDAMKAGTAAENAPRRKLLIDEAITRMEKVFDDAIDSADAAGVTTMDGSSIRVLKEEADRIWAQQVEDFQNTAITKILENTDLVNGAPDELVTQFLKSPANAEKILKALDIAETNLQGEALNKALNTRQMIQGAIVERVMLPVNPLTGKYGMPDEALFLKNSTTIKMLMGEESYEAMRRLVSASAEHARATKSSTMAYAQKAREAGMTLQGIQGAIKADPSVIDKVGSTLIVALNAGKILTKPRNLKFAETLDDPKVSPAFKRRAFRFLVEEWTNYIQEQEDALSPEKREQLQLNEQLRMEDINMKRLAN